MSNSTTSPTDHLSRDEMMSALFANMVVQQTNMALVFLGKVPHPQTRETVRELDAAQMFIDQLEMLAVKTRGNLGKDEEKLLQQSLTMLRMEFVEAVERKDQAPDVAPAAATGAPAGSAATPIPETPASPIETDESRKRFTKKY